MPSVYAITNGNWSSGATWNTGSVPTSADDVFANNFTVNMDVNATVLSLNNTSSFSAVATPLMTSNTTPSPYAVTANDQTNGFAWTAFDRNSATSWFTTSGSLGAGNIIFDFSAGDTRVIKAYSIFTPSINATANPRVWTFDGSNNGSTWTTLDSVTLGSSIGASSVYNSAILANTTAYRYYRLNVTSTTGSGGVQVGELALWEANRAFISAGGSFNFNTAGVTVTCTSTSASLSAGATNLITVTATTGTVTLNLGSSVTGLGVTLSQLFNYTGACNFNLSGVNFNAGGGNGAYCINKSSSGTITITGNLFGGGNTSTHSLNSTAGNTVVIGNVSGSNSGSGISQSSGNVTVTGNVTGGIGSSIHGISLTGAASQFTINGNVTGGSGSSAHGITFSGTLGTVNGNVTGGGGGDAHGIASGTGGVNVTGNVISNNGNGLRIAANTTVTGNVFAGGQTIAITNGLSNNSFTVTVTGDVYASNTQAGIQLTGTGTQVVNLTGNMYNSLGRMAIWCPNVFISNTATTLWRVDTGGGDYKFLYSADTTPNLPATTNVRSGVTFGPALSLTGTMVVPAASDTRKNVPVDNTVGTAELTSADIISGINASSDPLAVRLKNALTDVTAGNLISQFKDS